MFLFSEHACIVVALGQESHLCHVPASGDGDMMTMEGMTQKHFQHRVPKEACAGAKKKRDICFFAWNLWRASNVLTI